MKLRMDRVLKGEFEAEGEITDVLKSTKVLTPDTLAAPSATPEFRPPPGPERQQGWADAWSAPYDKYEECWWNSFLPDAEA